MRTWIAGTTALILTSCSTPEERRHDALMDQIEGQVQLPKGASPLDDYIRVYAAGGKDQVIASYALSSVVSDAAKQECADVAIDGSAKAVPCVSPVVRAAKPGDRVWVSRSGDLPFQDVHGCEVITLAYKLSEQRFEELGCVGQRPVR